MYVSNLENVCRKIFSAFHEPLTLVTNYDFDKTT